MHDPTEGGIATALHEMAQAARATLNVDVGAIPVLDETRHVCDALALDPMGLLASGALLAIVDGTSSETVKRALRDKGIDCEVIGRVEAGAAEAIMTAGDQAKPLPVFTRDEIARFYDECQQPGGQ
jgi:hydrogenase maturation factor